MLTKTHLAIAVAAATASLLWTVAFGQSTAPATRAEVKAETRAAEKAGLVQDDIPGNHSPRFLPVLQPTLRTGTEALVTAALAWLAPQPRS